jgi:chaperonin GroEL
MLDDKKKELILAGITETAQVVASSLGPKGSKVALVKSNLNDGNSGNSQDGVNILKQMVSAMGREGHFHKFGAQLLFDASNKTVMAAGDGTTTTCLLAWKLIEATKEAEVSIVPILRKIAEDVTSQINELSRKPSQELLQQMAIVTARSRPDVGKDIANLIWELGPKAHIKAFPGSETKTEIKKGYEMDTSMIVPTFWRWGGGSYVVKHMENQIDLIEPYTILIEEVISDEKVGIKILEEYVKKCPNFERPLVLIVSDINGAALQFLVQNFSSPKRCPDGQVRYLPVFPVRAPEKGQKRIEVLDDLKAGLGGGIYSKYEGKKAKNFSGDFGKAKSVTIFPNTVHVLFNEDKDEAIMKYAKKLSDEERKSKLTKGVGIIHIGGRTEIEHGELNEVIEDVVRASQASLEHGVLPGSGWALRKVRLPNTEAGEIFRKAFEDFFEILTGLDEYDDDRVYNIVTEKWEDPEETEIWDSCKSITESVLNATSLACEVLAVKHAVLC